jgi:hypothetical protein
MYITTLSIGHITTLSVIFLLRYQALLHYRYIYYYVIGRYYIIGKFDTTLTVDITLLGNYYINGCNTLFQDGAVVDD